MEKKILAYVIVNRFIFLQFDQWQWHQQQLRKVENELMVSDCGVISKVDFEKFNTAMYYLL